MSADCPCGGACLCHDNPLAKLELLGIDWRKAKLTVTEFSLVAALVPAGTLRTYAQMWDALHPDETWIDQQSSNHGMTVHASRVRPKIRSAGLTVETVPGIGMRLVPLDAPARLDRGFADAVRAFLADEERQQQALDWLQRGVTQASAALAVGLKAQQLATARKESTAFDGRVKDALQAAARDRANRAPEPAAPAPQPAEVDDASDAGSANCTIEACGRPLSEHVRCPGCTLLVGPGHTLLALRPGALCPACHEAARRRALSGGTPGSAPRPVDWGAEPAFA